MKKFIFTLTLIITFLITVKLIDNYYSNTTSNYIYSNVNTILFNYYSKIINECINPYLENDLLFINTTEKVNNVIINTSVHNKILGSVNTLLNNIYLDNKLNIKSLKLPIGSLISENLLFGKGFNITIPIKLTSTYDIDLKTKTESFGINSSIIKTILTVSFDVYTIIPFNNKTYSIKQEYLLSEALIQGDVPNYYYATNDLKSFPYVPTLTSQINSK